MSKTIKELIQDVHTAIDEYNAWGKVFYDGPDKNERYAEATIGEEEARQRVVKAKDDLKAGFEEQIGMSLRAFEICISKQDLRAK